MAGTLFNVTYRVTDEDGDINEDTIEIIAVSEEQAAFLAPCSMDEILYIERVVVKAAATG